MSNLSLNSDAADCCTCRYGLVALDLRSHLDILSPTKKVKRSFLFLVSLVLVMLLHDVDLWFFALVQLNKQYHMKALLNSFH